MDHFSIVVLFYLYSFFKINVCQTTAKSICTEIGAFEIYDGTCRNYYICVDDGEKLNSVILSCASSAIFDPSLGRCVPENTTICQQTTTITLPSSTSTPLCVRYGRFPIQDMECKKYYLCYWNGIQYDMIDNLSCPNTLIFNPISEQCVSPQMYKCPNFTCK